MSKALVRGYDIFGEPMKEESRGKVTDKFIITPFSILNTRDSFWQDRKRQWSSLGMKSELGRDAPVINMNNSTKDGETVSDGYTSIFDPVLCELHYKWFSPKNGHILDPFAGGSVRGIIASHCERNYTGVELRADQVESNNEQKELCDSHLPTWINGDSCGIATFEHGQKYDYVFSCPPYADLEVYSDDERDLSTMKYLDFLNAYEHIIDETCKLLKDDSFGTFVVGEVRGKDGNYYNFVGDTVRAFERAGLKYYNESILVTPVGSTSMRITKQFEASRKVGKTHQNVLTFVKGCPKKAVKKIKTI